jgi:hypothetical protein
MLARNQLITVHDVLSTIDWSRLSHRMDPTVFGARAVVMAVEAGERVAAVGAVVKRPKLYGSRQQLTLDQRM